MDWIKAKYEQVILLAAAVILIASSTFVILNTLDFQSVFANYLASFARSNTIKPLAIEPITTGRQVLADSAKWQTYQGSLFVSQKIVLTADGKIQLMGWKGKSFFPGFDNKWFFDNNLDVLQPDILDQDPDGDRFTNREEYLAKTNPRDPQSHPPYTDKLVLKKFIKKPFRIIFSARDDQTCQLNTLDIRQPSQFLKVGDQIAGTKFKLEKLTVKECVSPLGNPIDCSELLIRNVDSGEPIVLVVGQIGDSPDVFADFKYAWDNSEFIVKKKGDFKLKPDDATTYKLIDINDTEAKIKNLANDAEIKIPNIRSLLDNAPKP